MEIKSGFQGMTYLDVTLENDLIRDITTLCTTCVLVFMRYFLVRSNHHVVIPDLHAAGRLDPEPFGSC